jgi:hypothetical protein
VVVVSEVGVEDKSYLEVVEQEYQAVGWAMRDYLQFLVHPHNPRRHPVLQANQSLMVMDQEAQQL